jgi:O-antigen/teichoic acid export membrane protein
MAKIFALGAYFYQAILAFGLLIVVARLLQPSDYAGYSVFLAATQFGAIASFEWIRFACTRFYPGLSAETEAVQRKTILLEFVLCAALCFAGGLLTIAFGAPVELAVLGGVIAVFQGGSDLHLTVVRFGKRFRAFSWLQGLRATLLAIGTILGTIIGHGVLAAIIGLLAGYLAYTAMAIYLDRKAYAKGGQWSPTVAREHLVYGSVSAGVSVLALLSPLGLKLILTSTLGAAGSAGVLLALDLLQRPFTLIVSAMQAIQYPDVVEAFDRNDPALPRHLGQFYALLITLSLVAAAGVFVILRPVAVLAVGPELQAQFLATAPLVAIFSMLRSLTQNMSTTPAHLELNLKHLTLLALADCLSFNILAFAASQVFGAASIAITGGATIGAVLAGLFGLWIMASLRYELPRLPILIGIAGAVLPAGLFFKPVGNEVQSFLVSGLAAGAISLLALYALYRAMKRDQAVPQAIPA